MFCFLLVRSGNFCVATDFFFIFQTVISKTRLHRREIVMDIYVVQMYFSKHVLLFGERSPIFVVGKNPKLCNQAYGGFWTSPNCDKRKGRSRKLLL